MARQIIDISIFLENDVISDPIGMQPKIEYIDHQASVAGMTAFFPRLEKADLPDGEGWAVERGALSTHNGTHLDAPYHFHSTMNEAVTLSFTIYRRSPWSVGDAADPKPPVVSNAPRSAVQTVSPLILSAPTTPALPK